MSGNDSITLWKNELAADPASPIAHVCLGTALIDSERYDEAAAEIRQQLALGPLAIDRRNLVTAISRKKWLQEHGANYYNNLGVDLSQQGYLEEGRWLLAKSLQSDPNSAITHENMASDPAPPRKEGRCFTAFSEKFPTQASRFQQR